MAAMKENTRKVLDYLKEHNGENLTAAHEIFQNMLLPSESIFPETLLLSLPHYAF